MSGIDYPPFSMTTVFRSPPIAPVADEEVAEAVEQTTRSAVSASLLRACALCRCSMAETLVLARAKQARSKNAPEKSLTVKVAASPASA